MVSPQEPSCVCRRRRSANRQVSCFLDHYAIQLRFHWMVANASVDVQLLTSGFAVGHAWREVQKLRDRPPGGAVETHSAGLAVGYLPSCRAHLGVVTYLLALRSSRRLWPAPTTAPLAAFPPMAPIAAPLAAPLALGWVVSFGGGCVFGGVCVAAGGVCAGG